MEEKLNTNVKNSIEKRIAIVDELIFFNIIIKVSKRLSKKLI